MSSPKSEPFLVILLLEASVGLSLSLFTIICLSFGDTKRNRISIFSRILMALNASNMCYTFTMSTNFLISFLWPNLYIIPYVMYIIFYMTMYSITSTSWLTSTLCFFYFLKILPSQPKVLTKMKTMTSPIIGVLLLSSEVVSLLGSFLSILITNPSSIEINSNETQLENLEEPMRKVTFMDIVLALNCLPSFLIIVTTLVSALLLKHYNGQMKKNIGNINTNVQDYRAAVQTMTALLMFYLIIFMSVIIFSMILMGEKTWGYWICVILLFSFPSVQSALLINGNPKLKEVLRKIFNFIALTQGSNQ